jgi:hypothetical protein
MRRQNPVVSHHVKPGRRQHGANPSEQVARLEDQRDGAVAPRLLHGVDKAAVLALAQALLSDGRSAEVAADALDAFSVAAIESESGVDVEAEHLGDRLGVTTELGSHQTQDGLTGTRAEQAHTASGGAIARGEGQLLFGERVVFGVARALEQALERAAVALEDAPYANRRAARDLGDLFA